MTELVIFDCDGVLVDSDRVSLRIQAEWMTELGLATTYENCVRDFLGLGMPKTLLILGERLGRPLPTGWKEGLEDAVTEAFERELEPVAGVIEALDRIDLQTCVASNGSQEKMELTLGLTGLWDRFAGRIYSADEVSRGKPAPDLFQHAASKMGAAPEQCAVVEDSSFGVIAAKAAGMSVFGYVPDGKGESLEDEGARIFTSMSELPSLVHPG